MEYSELKSCINAAKTEDELLEARKGIQAVQRDGRRCQRGGRFVPAD